MDTKEEGAAMGRSTRAIHAGRLPKPVYGEVSVPIFQTSTFAFPSAAVGAARFAGEVEGFIYTRLSNPTTKALEENLAALEGGFGALATATGMGAITTLFLSVLDQGAHVVSTDSIYGATRVILESELPRFGIQTTFVDSTDLRRVEDAMRPNTRLIYIETPTNPTMKLTDIQGAAAVAHRGGALLAVDNTFASPYLQRPLGLGADLVVHSLTKFINGHSDVVGGAIVAGDEKRFKQIRRTLHLTGATMDPHQAWLILRGVRTLALRLEKAEENAQRLAEFLSHHPKVTWVRYPGLTLFPSTSWPNDRWTATAP